MEPVYKKAWYAPWLSDKFSCDLFLTCQLQSAVDKHNNWPSRRLVTGQPASAQGTSLSACLITHAKIWNELLIPFFFFLSFSSTHAKAKKRARYFECLLKSDVGGIMLGINLASCSQSCFPLPWQTRACFQFAANFSVVPAHSEKV